MFDRWSDLGDKRRCLLERSWAGVFRNHLLVELPVDDLCRHLDERMCRPSKDLHVVIGVLLLQQLHDLSDAATVEALAFNMAWHYALDTRSEADSYFCEKTLRNYRRLFIEQGLDEMLFRRLTDRLVQAFSVDTSRQRMDSTALRSAMRALTRLGIVVETISKFARELERRHPGLCRLIDDDVIARYVVREGEGCFANTAPSVSKRRLGEAGQDLLALAVQFRNTAAAKLSSFTILEQVLRDQFEIVDVVPKARLQRDDDDAHGAPLAAIRASQDVPCDTVGNPSDPDASYNAHKGQGYVAQIVETYCEDGNGNDGGDDVAHSIEVDVVRYRRFGVDLRRNDRESALISYRFSNRAGVIGLIGDDRQRRSRPAQQVRQNLAVMNLAAGDVKTPGAAILIDYGVNFARAASS